MAETAAFFGQPLSPAYLSSTPGEGTQGDPEAKVCVWVCPAILNFFHWASQLHSVHAPMWGGGSHLQGAECWFLTYCCVSAQKAWQRLWFFNLEKKDFEFHLPAQSSAPLLLSSYFFLLTFFTCQRNEGATGGHSQLGGDSPMALSLFRTLQF